eukprot:3617254-Rhodomonas_salina.4
MTCGTTRLMRWHVRTRLDGSISSKEATELRTKVSEQEFELAELKINASKFQEIADLATDQAKAMEELHQVPSNPTGTYQVHLEELQSMRTYVSQVQSESDEQAEHGLLQRKLMDKQVQLACAVWDKVFVPCSTTTTTH